MGEKIDKLSVSERFDELEKKCESLTLEFMICTILAVREYFENDKATTYTKEEILDELDWLKKEIEQEEEN